VRHSTIRTYASHWGPVDWGPKLATLASCRLTSNSGGLVLLTGETHCKKYVSFAVRLLRVGQGRLRAHSDRSATGKFVFPLSHKTPPLSPTPPKKKKENTRQNKQQILYVPQFGAAVGRHAARKKRNSSKKSLIPPRRQPRTTDGSSRPSEVWS
jgi:hypothetical protein